MLTSEISSDLMGRPGLDPGTLGLEMTMIPSRKKANSSQTLRILCSQESLGVQCCQGVRAHHAPNPDTYRFVIQPSQYESSLSHQDLSFMPFRALFRRSAGRSASSPVGRGGGPT